MNWPFQYYIREPWDKGPFIFMVYIAVCWWMTGDHANIKVMLSHNCISSCHHEFTKYFSLSSIMMFSHLQTVVFWESYQIRLPVICEPVCQEGRHLEHGKTAPLAQHWVIEEKNKMQVLSKSRVKTNDYQNGAVHMPCWQSLLWQLRQLWGFTRLFCSCD
jgi:hypothetical protein